MERFEVLQNLLFPDSEYCAEEALYFHKKPKGEIFHIEERMQIKKNTLVRFDTYFNSFSVNKWLKYTILDNLYLRLRLSGKFLVRVISKEKDRKNITSKIIHEKVYEAKQEEDVLIPVELSQSNGIYSFQVMALDKPGIYLGGAYVTRVNKPEGPKVKIAAIICTYRREDYIYRNIELLKKNLWMRKDDNRGEDIHVHIVDNGKTLDSSKAEDEHVHLYRNKNVGGAGGFTRGMIEVLRSEMGFTHVLMMDDDIIINPDALLRTYSLLSLLKDRYKQAFIGGAMLRKDYQSIQVEAGAVWNQGNLISLKAGLDLKQPENVVFNEWEETCDYNAWWYCTVPVSVIHEQNLPLPLFIRGDDVEYGIRNKKETILLNGICVWHEPFECKYSSSAFYYIVRNQLIINSIHGLGYGRKQFYRDFWKRYKYEVFCCKYKNAELLLTGVYDFLKGIDWLKEQDCEQLNQEIMEKGYRLEEIERLSLPFIYSRYRDTIDFLETRKQQIKRILSFNGLLWKKPDRFAIVPAVDPHIAYFYKVRDVLHYDDTSRKGFVTQFDGQKLFQCLKDYGKMKKVFRREYEKIAKEYFTRGRELMSLAFWKKCLNLEE